MKQHIAYLVLLLLCAPVRAQTASEAAPRLVPQLGHSGTVISAAFSPDGKLVVTTGDLTARLWSADTGEFLRAFEATEFDARSGAFSPDGRLIVTAGRRAARLWSAATGESLRVFEGHSGNVLSVAFSPDGRFLVTAADDSTARLWSVVTGEHIRTLRGHADWVRSAGFSPDGSRVLTASRDGTARLWSAGSGEVLQTFDGEDGEAWCAAISPDGTLVVTAGMGASRLWSAQTGEMLHRFESTMDLAAAFSPDGRRIVTGGLMSTPAIWSTETGELVRELRGEVTARSVSFSPGGTRIVTAGGSNEASVWSAETGELLQTLAGNNRALRSAALSADGTTIVTSDRDGARLWSTETGRFVRSFEGHSGDVSAAIISPEGDYLVTASDDATGRVWSPDSGELLHVLEGHSGGINSASFLPGGTHVLTAGEDGRVNLWSPQTGRNVADLTGLRLGRVFSVAYSPDHTRIATISYEGAHLWSNDTGELISELLGADDEVESPVFSPDGTMVVTIGWDVHLWSAETGEFIRKLNAQVGRVSSAAFSPKGTSLVITGPLGAHVISAASGNILHELEGHIGKVNSASFSSDGKWIITAGDDGTARLWSAETGEERVRLIGFRDGGWAVVDPSGRFDVPDLERVRGVHWVAADDPFTPIPLEAFMRDFYEPRLLARILAGEEFPETGSLLERNRVQPGIEITSTELQSDGTASVGVRVQSIERAYGGKIRRSEVHDIRLFRDGQLVAWADGLAASGTATAELSFDGIAVPSEGDTVVFSAYAFNSDRVKSRTAYAELIAAGAATSRPRRAYVISLGVNRFADPAWNLRFAAEDAHLMQQTLHARLDSASTFDEVVAVPLISETGGGTDARHESFRTVLDLLAGKPVPESLRTHIPHAGDILKATPDDLVLITVSTHGYTDSTGVFYLFPEDIADGSGGRITPELLNSAVSSDELSAWLRDVDAGEMVMIVDACHAAAAVEGAGFKPGPMGSRGLGQLAYNKGMRILTATQSADVALESDQLQQGLLTFALVNNGLEAGEADFQPEDGRTTLSEWLQYGVERVPALFEEVKRGEVQTFGGRGVKPGGKRDDAFFQQPSLFDFTRRPTTVVLSQ